jgi:hypothetical protein
MASKTIDFTYCAIAVPLVFKAKGRAFCFFCLAIKQGTMPVGSPLLSNDMQGKASTLLTLGPGVFCVGGQYEWPFLRHVCFPVVI